MTCYQCGTNLPAETKHCPVCGKNQIFTPRLLQAAMDGDQEAIERLYNRTYNAVYQTVKSMIRDEDTVLDIVQDSYVRGFQNLDRLREPGNFPAWMKRIATNTAKNWLKRKKPVLFTELENDDGEMMMDFEDDRTDNLPEAVMDQKETTRLVNEILDSLSDEQRLVVGMFYYQQYSVKQIAEMLDCSENTVKSRLNYARKKIRVQVEDLERRGTKLYSIAPIPFFLWLLRGFKEQGMEMPNLSVLDAVQNQCANLSTGGGGTAARPNRARARPAHSARTAARAGASGAKAAAGTAGKALAAKIAAGFVAVAVLSGGAAVVIPMITGSNDAPQPTEPPQQVVETMEPAYTAEQAIPDQQGEITYGTEEELATPEVQAYQTILKNYAATLGMDHQAFLAAPERYPFGDLYRVRINHEHPGSLLYYYAYYDIDGNGTYELLIGDADSNNQFTILDLYVFDGEAAVRAVDHPELRDGAFFWLTSGNTVSVVGTEGPGPGGAPFANSYRIASDGFTLVEVSDRGEFYTVRSFNWQPLEPDYAAGAALEAETPVATAEQAYQTVLAQYRATMDMDNETFQLDTDAYFHGDYNLMRYYKNGRGGGFYYAYYDIDGNGVDELLIGADAGGESPEVIDVYAFDGETAVQVINDHALGEWDHIYIYENGVMLNRINNFTQGYHYKQWTIDSDGHTPQLVDDFAVTASEITYDDNFNTVFVINGQRLSLDEFESLRVGSGDKVPVSAFDWKPIPTAEELGALPVAPGQTQSTPAVSQKIAYVGVYRQNTEPYRKLEVQKMADGSYKVLWEITGHVYLTQEINGHLEAKIEGPEGMIILSFTQDGDQLTVEGNEKYYENMYVVSLHGTYSLMEE